MISWWWDENSQRKHLITKNYSYLMKWASKVDFHDKDGRISRALLQKARLHESDLPTCWTAVLLFSMEKMKHFTKLLQKAQAKMAKLISRFTNNEECPFWPLFLWSCHWRPGAILSGQNTSQGRRGRGRATDRELSPSVSLSVHLNLLNSIYYYMNAKNKVQTKKVSD